MTMHRLVLIALVNMLAASAGADAVHHGYVWLEGPDGPLQPNTTYTIEAWARWESPLFVQGTSAMAGFAFDILNTLGGGTHVASVWNVTFPEWASQFGRYDAIEGGDILGISGGQLADLFGAPPTADRRNPIPLFTFNFTTASGPVGNITFAPTQSGSWGGLSFYPVRTDPYQVVAPTDPGTELHMLSWTYVVPASSTMAATGVAIVIAMGRRRRCEPC